MGQRRIRYVTNVGRAGGGGGGGLLQSDLSDAEGDHCGGWPRLPASEGSAAEA